MLFVQYKFENQIYPIESTSTIDQQTTSLSQNIPFPSMLFSPNALCFLTVTLSQFLAQMREKYKTKKALFVLHVCRSKTGLAKLIIYRGWFNPDQTEHNGYKHATDPIKQPMAGALSTLTVLTQVVSIVRCVEARNYFITNSTNGIPFTAYNKLLSIVGLSPHATAKSSW